MLARIRRQMANDGFLYLGGAETVIGVSDAFKTVSGSRGVYTISDGTSGSPGRSAAPPLAKSA